MRLETLIESNFTLQRLNREIETFTFFVFPKLSLLVTKTDNSCPCNHKTISKRRSFKSYHLWALSFIREKVMEKVLNLPWFQFPFWWRLKIFEMNKRWQNIIILLKSMHFLLNFVCQLSFKIDSCHR